MDMYLKYCKKKSLVLLLVFFIKFLFNCFIENIKFVVDMIYYLNDFYL